MSVKKKQWDKDFKDAVRSSIKKREVKIEETKPCGCRTESDGFYVNIENCDFHKGL